MLPSQDIDTDGDGIIDRVDVDDDNDGILDVVENRNPPLINPIAVSANAVPWLGDTDTQVRVTTNMSRDGTHWDRSNNGTFLATFDELVSAREIDIRLVDFDRAASGTYTIQLTVEGDATFEDFEVAPATGVSYDSSTGIITVAVATGNNGNSNQSVIIRGTSEASVDNFRVSYSGGRSGDTCLLYTSPSPRD